MDYTRYLAEGCAVLFDLTVIYTLSVCVLLTTAAVGKNESIEGEKSSQNGINPTVNVVSNYGGLLRYINATFYHSCSYYYYGL